MVASDCIWWKGRKLAHTLHLPQANGVGEKKTPLIIICHGFTSTRIGVDRLFVKTAQALVKLGYAVLRFDYAGCGESEGEYGENEFACFIDQTKEVISFGSKLPSVEERSITLIGHSLGGAVAACTAADDDRVHNVITWSAVGNPFADIKEIVGYNGEHAVVDHLGYAITEEFLFSLESYSPLEAIQQFSGNALFIHGTSDPVISCNYCLDYYEHSIRAMRGTTSMFLIEGANHTYSSIKHFDKLITATSEWLLTNVTVPVQNNLKKSV
ncbi:alpha/beta fold hydrolase [Fictibacillus nanhaiensis]|uniref:Alpha/beta fold hydrolase n=1 Tax=Fictibacillus nanhaiensis TaxID=742169 RepID=A0ABS2ZUC5_9BACL|nr:alpha/beta fold hydrolase [Fictibacillus nanhaiensis]